MKRVYTAVIVIMFITILLFTTVNVASTEISQQGTKMLSYSKSGYEQDSFLGKFKLREITEKDVRWLEMIIQKKEMDRNLYYRDIYEKSGVSYPIIDGHATGFKLPSKKELPAMIGKKMIVDVKNSHREEVSSVRWDLDPHFPPVGEQGMQGSCVAWAVSYYQNGFLQRRIYNWTDASPAHLMSPAWTYPKVNGGSDSGSMFETNAEVIKTIGGATWANMSYYPFDFISWGNESAWRDAPKHRIEDYYVIYFGNDSGIEVIKEMLREGYLVTFSIDAYEYGDGFLDGNYVISSQEYHSIFPNHGQTIVGYDDSITDDGEVGAFRIVNSWGTEFADNGFYWITYKALKEKISQGWPYAYVLLPKTPEPYTPKLLAVWHFSDPKARDASINLTFGSENSNMCRAPYLRGGTLRFPYFMALDISEFYDSWKASGYSSRFYLKIGHGETQSEVSSFRVEYYPYGYKLLWQESDESPDVPTFTPAVVRSSLITPQDKSPYLYIKLSEDILHRYVNSNKTEIIVGNAGNFTDAFILNAEISNSWQVNLSKTKVILSPNETCKVDLIVDPPPTADLGNTSLLTISAISQNYSSVSFSLSFPVIYTSPPIYAENNSILQQCAIEYGWLGNGSKKNPYIVEGLYIYRENIPGIYLHSTDLYIHIKNSTINSTVFGIALFGASNTHFTNITITHSLGCGINGLGSKHIIIEYSKVFNNRGTITWLNSNNNIFKNNSFHSNYHGIYFILASNNTLVGNEIYDINKEFNLLLSNRNRFYSNTFRDCGIKLEGDFETYTTQEIPSNNTVNGKPLYYYKNIDMSGLSVPKNAGEIIVANVTNLYMRDLEIYNTTRGIFIAFSSNITIENTTVYNTVEAISTAYTSDMTIRKNRIYNNTEMGIYLDWYSTNNRIEDNVVYGNGAYGIFVWWYSHNIRIENNTVYNNGDAGVSLWYINYSFISKNKIWNNAYYGLFLIWYSCHNQIENNTVYENGVSFMGAGIYLYESSYNIIKNNQIYYNSQKGIEIMYSSDNLIEHNNLYNNSVYGLFIENSSRMSIENNSLYYNDWGISICFSFQSKVLYNEIYENQIGGMEIYSMWTPSQNITIMGNEIYNNSLWGSIISYVENILFINNTIYGHIPEMESVITSALRFLDARNSTIEENTLYSNRIGILLERSRGNLLYKNKISNSEYYGIRVEYYSEYNLIKYNNINDNGIGISFDQSNNNTVWGNTVYNDTTGVEIKFSNNNTIWGNTVYNGTTGIKINLNSNGNFLVHNLIMNNTGYGVSVNWNSGFNIIYNNSFYYNHGSNEAYNSLHIQAYDENGTNLWDYNGRGNFWMDWTEPDEDGDGIVDEPYVIAGISGVMDHFPLTEEVPIPEFGAMYSVVILLIIALALEIYRKKNYT